MLGMALLPPLSVGFLNEFRAHNVVKCCCDETMHAGPPASQQHVTLFAPGAGRIPGLAINIIATTAAAVATAAHMVVGF